MTKKFYLLPLLTVFLISSCSSSSEGSSSGDTSSSEASSSGTSIPDTPLPSDDDYVYPVRHGQDTPILHCFNWSIKNVEAKLDDIKEAGFKTIQLSPLQPQKEPMEGHWYSQWWKLYQPMGFSVSTSTAQNVLGTKLELTSLCEKAKAKGIDVIVDVVANHLGGGSEHSLNYNVRNYEPKIYDDELIHKLGRGVDDNDPEALLRGYLGGFPDLQTENEYVQSRVLSLLKEYIDAGVSGFRFDATKHIETSEDGEYSSNFWSTILNGTREYAKAKGQDEPYYYGEVLYTVGKGREVEWYTRHMSLTDNQHGNKAREGVEEYSLGKCMSNFYIPSDKAVLWAESHDTYSNAEEESTYTTIKNINKAYVIETSRKGASTLYLSRPQGNMGSVGDLSYELPIVRAINNFHNICADFEEEVSTQNGYFINERNHYGAVIVDVEKSSSNRTINFANLKDGKYINLIDNEVVNVIEGKADIIFNDDVAILLYEDFAKLINEKPSVVLGTYDEIFSGSQNINVSARNADSLTYQINVGEIKNVTNNVISLDNSLSNGTINIKIVASNQIAKDEKTIRLVKTNLIDKAHLLINVDTSYSNMIWHWQGFNEGSWANTSLDNNIIGYDNGSNDRYTIVKFPLGTTIENVDWNDALYQTDDLNVPIDKIIDYSQLSFHER